MILHFMKSGADLLSSFDRSWKEFSEAWKSARSKGSEKSIHDLRVKTRRLIAVLELAQALSRRNGIDKLRRRFKKVLKSMVRSGTSRFNWKMSRTSRKAA